MVDRGAVMNEEPGTTAMPATDAGALPRRVRRAAEHSNLGALVMGGKGTGFLRQLAVLLAVEAVLAGLLAAAMATGSRLLAWLPLIGLLGVAIVIAMRTVSGPRRTYVFADGVVCTRFGAAKAARWDQVRELLLWRAGGKTFLAGKLLAYYLITQDGSKLAIEARTDGPDPLGEMVKDFVRRAGRPVVDSGPYHGRMRP
jgi:hypothetical protein